MISAIGANLWDLISIELRNVKSFDNFKIKVQKWISDKCL